MKPTTKRIALIIAGALISGAALMAQGAASPTTKSTVKAPAAQTQVKTAGAAKSTPKTAAKSTSKARKTAKTAKASHRRHRRARKTTAALPQVKSAK